MSYVTQCHVIELGHAHVLCVFEVQRESIDDRDCVILLHVRNLILLDVLAERVEVWVQQMCC